MPKKQRDVATESRYHIPDNRVFLIWQDPDTGKEVAIAPNKCAKQGAPKSADTGKDMVYSRTEIVHRNCYYCDDTGRADGGKCWEC